MTEILISSPGQKLSLIPGPFLGISVTNQTKLEWFKRYTKANLSDRIVEEFRGYLPRTGQASIIKTGPSLKRT